MDWSARNAREREHRARKRAAGIITSPSRRPRVENPYPTGSIEYHRWYRYGLTPEQFDAMFTAQGGKCAICLRDKPLVVDHDHKTGKVRGLLCNGCNTSLGKFQDSPEMLQRAILYVSG